MSVSVMRLPRAPGEHVVKHDGPRVDITWRMTPTLMYATGYFRYEPIGTKAHPFLSKKMTIALPPISWRLI